MKRLGLLKENHGVSVVALTPFNVKSLSQDFIVIVESGAGALAGFSDAEYVSADAEIVTNRDMLIQSADILVTYSSDISLTGFESGKIIIGSYSVLEEYAPLLQFKNNPIDFYSLALLPRDSNTPFSDEVRTICKDDFKCSSTLVSEQYLEFIKCFNLRSCSEVEDHILGTTLVTRKGVIVHQELIDQINKY